MAELYAKSEDWAKILMRILGRKTAQMSAAGGAHLYAPGAMKERDWLRLQGE
jgi:hypothetical protein